MVRKHATFLFAHAAFSVQMVYVWLCVGYGGVVVASYTRSATRSHRPCEVVVPLIVVRWALGRFEINGLRLVPPLGNAYA